MYVCSPRPQTVATSLRQLWAHRALLAVLVRRDLKIRYKHTVVGAAWNLLQPIALMLVFTLVFSVLLKSRVGDVPYALFIYPAILLWGFFSRCLVQGGTSVEGFTYLLNKIFLPRLVAPVSTVLSALVDLALAGSAMIVLLAIYRTMPGPEALLAPLFVVITFVLGLGIAIGLSALDVRYKDVRHTLPFLTQLWMFFSPIVYSLELVPPDWRRLYAVNPMVGVIEGFRWSLVPGSPPPDAWMLGWSVAWSVLALVLGTTYFNAREGTLIDGV